MLIIAGAAADTDAHAQLPEWFSPELVWTGSWTQDAAFINRVSARARFHFEKISPWLDFKLRGDALDSRNALNPAEDGRTLLGAGLYHRLTSSRILYGPLSITGLPARIKNIWQHSASFVTAHNALSVDLRTEPAASAKPALFAQLWSPSIFGIKLFAAYTQDAEKGLGNVPAALSSGAEAAFTKKTKLAFEFYEQELILPERAAGGWFSEKNALPERKSRIYSGTASFLSPYVSLAGDFAYSETFAFGRGTYWNCGLQIGDKPWRVALAADRATPHFVDGAGAVPEQWLRTAFRAELYRKKNELWKIQTTLRGYQKDKDAFVRSSSLLYYRFPLSAQSKNIAPSRISLAASRNADNPQKILDSWDLSFGVKLWKARAAASFSLDEYTHDSDPFPFPDPRNTYIINEWKFAAEASMPFSFLTLTAKAGLASSLDSQSAEWKKPALPFSFAVRAQSLYGRFSLKAETPDFPNNWKLTISWRLQYI